MLLDIGGGSMKIALGRDADSELAILLSLGAGRLARQLPADDPPSRAQFRAMRRYIRDTVRAIADRVRWDGDGRRVVATSKTVKQLARLSGAPPQRKARSSCGS